MKFGHACGIILRRGRHSVACAPHLIWVAVPILDRQLRLCRLSLCRNQRLSLRSRRSERLFTQRSDGELSRLNLIYILKNTF